ncbi:MAG: glutamate--tRNA ligase [Steroidobacteraceae bacterium]
MTASYKLAPMSAVVTRFAPSPSGALHLGNARTALFSWLLARRDGGRFVLRIEDTDAERSQAEHIVALQDDLRWLGLHWNEGPDIGGPNGPYLQSQRSASYDAAFADLEQRGLAYPCWCTPLELDVARRSQLAAGRPPRYAGTCRDLDAAQRAARAARASAPPTLRFRVPAGRSIGFDDLVHGPQQFATDDIGDFVIRRGDGTAAFFFCNALDDAAMGITHVLRGEDHLTNTPRQLLLLEALGQPAPRYGHVALLMGSDGAPLSKRAGARSLGDLRRAGYLPEAVVNHLFRLGHSSPLQGLQLPDALARGFTLEHLGCAPARFDDAQLASWQKDAAHALSEEAALVWLLPAMPPGLDPAQRAALITAVRANVVLPEDATRWARIVREQPAPLDAAGRALLEAAGDAFFDAAAAAAASQGAQPADWPALTAAVRAATGAKGPALFKPLRIALTGLDHGPELAPLLPLFPPGAVQQRLLNARHPD